MIIGNKIIEHVTGLSHFDRHELYCILNLLRGVTQSAPEHPAFLLKDHQGRNYEITLLEFLARVNGVVAHLLDLRVQAGERLGFSDPLDFLGLSRSGKSGD